MKSRLVLVALSCVAAVSAWGQEPSYQAVESLAKRLWREQGHDQRNFHAEAVRDLRGRHNFYDIERLEITGFQSEDDTGKFEPGLFDRQVKPSFRARDTRRRNPLRRLFRGPGDFVQDARNTILDINGNLSPAGREAVREIRDMEVNEIVAHSWGSVLAYNAILEYEMHPPKKLILIGVPGFIVEMWQELARHVPIEIQVVLSDSDTVQGWGGVISKKLLGPQVGDEESIASRRHLAMLRVGVERANSMRSGPGSLQVHNVHTSGHGREDYYRALREKGIIRDSLEELRQQSSHRISGREFYLKTDAWNEAMLEAKRLLDDAKRLKEKIAREKESSPVYATPPPSAPAVIEFLKAWEIKEMVKKACEDSGGVSVREAEGKPWVLELDEYNAEMGADLTGCAREIWILVGRVRERHAGGSLVLNAAGLNKVAREVRERLERRSQSGQQPPPRQDGKGPSSDSGVQDAHDVDLSRAEEIVRKLKSPF